jgi:hypothetical protein
MAQLNNVNPGDLITAANWNALVAAIQGLSGQAAAGPITVPNLFSLTLGNALAILTLPSTQLAVGTVLDTLGNVINSTTAAGAKSLIVLNQMPPAGSNVFAGSAVNLVVSPLPGSTPPPPVIPAITSFKPTSVNIGTQLEIDGTNLGPGAVSVTFAGVAAAPPTFPPSSPDQIFVVVPQGIPGAPTGTNTLSVPVVVTTSNGQSQPMSVTILAPLANPLPTIASFSPTDGVVGSTTPPTTITGTGFDTSAAANNVVSFGGVKQPAASVLSTTQLTVVIPSGIPGVTSSGAFVPITVTVNGQQSPTVTYFILS